VNGNSCIRHAIQRLVFIIHFAIAVFFFGFRVRRIFFVYVSNERRGCERESGIARAALSHKNRCTPEPQRFADVLLTSHFAGLVLALAWELSGWLGYCTFYTKVRKSHFDGAANASNFKNRMVENTRRTDDVDVSI